MPNSHRSIHGADMAVHQPLNEAIATHVRPGHTIGLEGFTHLIPYAAGHEIIRQGIDDLSLIRMTPDVLYDQFIGMGLVRKLTFSWGGNPGVGSLHRLRDAVENSWPRAIEIEEHSHAGMAARYAARASGLPFGVLRGYTGTDLPSHTSTIASVKCPFTGEELAAVPALRPDVGIVHAQQADRSGNVGLWGIQGVQKETLLASDHAIVTVEEVVDELDPRCTVVIPHWTIDAVAEVPRGAHPSYAHSYYERDNNFYSAWDSIARDRETFTEWMRMHVLTTNNFSEHLALLALESELGVEAVNAP